MKDTIIITSTLVLGIALGLYGREIIPSDISTITTWLLYSLLFCVVLGVGSDRTLLKKIKNTSPIYLLLPVATIVGTLLGSAVSSIFLPHRSLADCLAVGSGFGYYSLSSILITQIKGIDLGVVALLSNVMREVLVIIFAVQLVKYFGKGTPICCAGATSMDSTLPFIANACGKEYIIISLVHGIMVDFTVPFFVSFFCSL